MSCSTLSFSRMVFPFMGKTGSNQTKTCMQYMQTSYRASSSDRKSTLDPKWRRKQRLPMNPNSTGVLTDGADFSYLDGRPAPPGLNQLKRLARQQEIAQRVVELNTELNFAIERRKNMELLEEEKRNKILSSKLKPKGKALLKESS